MKWTLKMLIDERDMIAGLLTDSVKAFGYCFVTSDQKTDRKSWERKINRLEKQIRELSRKVA